MSTGFGDLETQDLILPAAQLLFPYRTGLLSAIENWHPISLENDLRKFR